MSAPPPHYDCVVVGAGFSGISAAHYLKESGFNFVLLERRENLGGTWDFFNYPGLRSDSDMHTFGFCWRPWSSTKVISPKKDILAYLNTTVDEEGLREYFQFSQDLRKADFSSSTAQWRLETATGKVLTSTFLFMTTGYYDYEEAHRPTFPNEAAFNGQIVHPQFWPKDMDYTGKNVVVIGSGATAATLVPALAEKAEKVTMLQRSPGYFVPAPSEATDSFLMACLAWLSPTLHHKTRWWTWTLGQRLTYVLSRRYPTQTRRRIKEIIKAEVPADWDLDKHATPSWDPWDQRMCLIPDSDFYKGLHDKSVAVVTDHVAQFEPGGIRTKDGQFLPADIVVSATGLKLQSNFPMSTVHVSIDGRPYDAPDSMVFRGCMLSDVPNLCFTMGYANASWTLKADMVSKSVCDLLAHMKAKGHDIACPRSDGIEPADDQQFFELTSGYLQRAKHRMPKQGPTLTWQMPQDVLADLWRFTFGAIDGRGLEFSSKAEAMEKMAQQQKRRRDDDDDDVQSKLLPSAAATRTQSITPRARL